MTVLVSILGVWAVALALLGALGYGIGRWLTPPALKPYELWLMPLWGYALLVLIAYYGLNVGLTLRHALAVASGVAVALGIWRLLKARERLPRAPLNETLLIVAIGLVAGVLGVVPLLRAGYLAPIGHGWDIEFYLPLAAYLQDYSYLSLSSAAPAPLLNVILAEPTSVRAIGYSYLHGVVDLLGGWSPVGTFPLLLALLRSLAVAPVYLVLRAGLRANVKGAALGALLVGGNELLLWIGFNNFAMHVSSMPLVPLATLLTLLALASCCLPGNSGDPRRFWRGHGLALAGAIAATTALTLSYHPALLAYGALAGGLGVWALATQRAKLAVVLRGLAIMVGCLALGWLAHWRAPVAFFDVYRIQTPSIGGERFARPTELLGVETFHHLALAVDGPDWLSALSWLALGALLAGIGVALWRGAIWRGPALGLLAFALLYALGLRYVIAFPYGFYKGVSYLSFVPLGVAGVGLGSLLDRRPHAARLAHPLNLAAGAALTLLALGMTGWSNYRLLETYRAPVLASRALIDFVGALRPLEDSGTVLLVDHPELRGTGLGIASLGLYGHPWIGRGQTGFAVFNRLMPGRAAAYGLMHPSDDPRAWGFDPDSVVFRSPRMALYRAPDDAGAFLSGSAASYTPATGSLREGLDSLEVQDLTHGDFQTVPPGQSLRLYAGIDRDGERLSWQPLEADGDGESRMLALDLASAAPQTLTLSANGQTQRFDLARGVSRITTQPWSLPLTLELAASHEPIVVRSAQLLRPGARQAGVEQLADTLALRTTTEASAPTVTTMIDVTGAQRDVLHLGLELYEISERTPRRYAGGTLAVRANEPAALNLDLQALRATLNGGPVPIQPGDVSDGEYFGALWLYHGDGLVRRVPFVRFRRQAGQITAIQPIDANATFARVARPERVLDATVGPARLAGYTLAPQPIQPGADLRLGVQWLVAAPVAEPLLVFAQILGPDDHKWAAWDGAAGGDWWPSQAWQPDDRIWQSIPLKLDPATPPGRYRLVVGLYSAATGERLPVGGAQAQGSMIILDEIDVQR
ncbi:MAG TPA: hypothetical protein VFZ66_07745 [Herpetosiphonaceae bacterium]